MKIEGGQADKQNYVAADGRGVDGESVGRCRSGAGPANGGRNEAYSTIPLVRLR